MAFFTLQMFVLEGLDHQTRDLESSHCQHHHLHLGVFQRPLTLMLVQKYRDTNGSRIMRQTGVYTTFCQEEGALLQRYR